MNFAWKTILCIGSLLILPYLYELVLSLTTRRWSRRNLYKQAYQRAKLTQKPLLVVGDPDSGCINHYLGRDYGCGDRCLDLTGCPKCPLHQRLTGSLEHWLPKLKSNGYVVFVSCTLEYVEDMQLIADQLQRVSNGDLQSGQFKTRKGNF